MARKRIRTPLQQISEINLTPLIDLVFLLLITFIITYPMLEQSIQVKLPRGTADRLDSPKAQNVTVDSAGKVYLNSQLVSLVELERQLTEAATRQPDVAVLLRGDEHLDYGRMVQVLRVVRKARVVRMALVTEAE